MVVGSNYHEEFGVFEQYSVYLILRNFPEFRNFDRPAPPEKKIVKKKNWKKKCYLRKIPEKPLNKGGKVPAFLPNPYKLIHFKSNATQNMSDPYCREREKK